jgi:hypothetical protein
VAKRPPLTLVQARELTEDDLLENATYRLLFPATPYIFEAGGCLFFTLSLTPIERHAKLLT